MNNALNRPKKSISILGCGWLGLPLAKFFISRNFTIKGSTPTQEKISLLEKEKIQAFTIFLNPDLNSDFEKDFFNSEILIINFPPKRRSDIEEFHPKQFNSLIREINLSTIKKVIFISSTSVYANTNRVVTEKNNEIPEKSSGKALRKVEQMLVSQQNFTTTIVRFGGLIGYDRKPGRFFSNMQRAIEGEAPVNLIHQDDCINIISHIVENELWGEIYNACCPEHPTKKEFYEEAAKTGGFKIPQFSTSKSSCKIISSDKLIKETNYKFKYTNPIKALPF